MTRTRVSWRCAAGHTLLAIRGLRQGDLFTHPLPGGRTCATPVEPIEVETFVPTIPEIMDAAWWTCRRRRSASGAKSERRGPSGRGRPMRTACERWGQVGAAGRSPAR